MDRTLWFFAALVVLAVTACNVSDPVAGVQPVPDEPHLTSVTLQVAPSAVLLTEEGEQQELTVRAFDVDGAELPLDGLELEWSNSDPGQIRLDVSGETATVSAAAFLGSAIVTVHLRSDPASAAPPVHVIDARLHDDVELVPDSRIVFPFVDPPPGADPVVLPDIEVGGSGVTIGGFSATDLADRFAVDTSSQELLFPVVLRGDAPPLGALLYAGGGGAFAGEVVVTETRGAFALAQLRPVAPTRIFHDIRASFASSSATAPDDTVIARAAPHAAAVPERQDWLDLLTACEIDGNLGELLTFSLTPTHALEVAVDAALEIRNGEPVPERFMVLVRADAQFGITAGIEFGGTIEGEIECALELLTLDIPFPGQLAAFFSARSVLELVAALRVEITDGPTFAGSAGASVSGSMLVGFDYVSGTVIDLSDLPQVSSSLTEPVFESDAGTDKGVFDVRLGLFGRVTPGLGIGGPATAALKKLPSDADYWDTLWAKVDTVLSLFFFDMAEFDAGPELQATWMGHEAVLGERASSSFGGSNVTVNAAIKSDWLNLLLEGLRLSTLPRLELPTITIPDVSFFRPFAPGTIEVLSKAHSGPVKEGEVIPVRAGETISLITSGKYTFALRPLTDAPIEYGEVWLNHERYLDDLPAASDTMLAGIITIDEAFCGEEPFELAILGYNRMFTVETAGYLGAVTLECQDAGVALSPKDLSFGTEVNKSVSGSFTLTNLDEQGGDLVHYEVTINNGWLGLQGASSGTIAPGDSTTLGMTAQCGAFQQVRSGSFGFTFMREDANGDLFALTENVPASLPISLQCVKDDDDDDAGEGSSFGDPWLLTPDGAFYGFQAVGDYILVTSTEPGDPFEIQVRFRPFPGNWSANDALAMRVGNNVVNIYTSDEETLEVFIDGTEVSEGAHELSGGGSVAFSASVATVTWPDLTQVSIELHRDAMGAVSVVLPPSRRGAVEGLMGNFDGDPDNDIRIRGGEVLVEPSEEALYQDFRWSWRVPVGSPESLFVQGPEYWDPLFPTNVVRLEDLDAEAVEWAQSVCVDAGIIDQNVLHACTFDVALTGDEGWALVAAGVDPSILGVNVTPQLSHVVVGGSRQFGAVVSGTSNREIVWSATGGTIAPDTATIMTYTAPLEPGEYFVTARLAEDASIEQTVMVIVVEPRAVDLGASRGLAAGANHGLAVTEEGAVLAWGANGRGQLGDGTTTSRSLPVSIEALQGARAVAAGFAHSLALLDDGTVWAWGSNFRGQLGTGDQNQRQSPVQVSGLTDIVMIAAGGESSFALEANGTLWAWGDNFNGQLGVGSGAGSNVLEPRAVLDLVGVVAVAATYDHTLALTETGRVWAWGSNALGQLGSGNEFARSVPQVIESLEGVTAIASNYRVSMALTADGTVWVWGDNGDGVLGAGDGTSVLVPTQVPELSDVIAIAAAGAARLALREDGSLWSWGRNPRGELGIGHMAVATNTAVPVQVATVDDARGVVAGDTFAFAIREDGVVWGWGANSSGQLANGTQGSGNRSFWPGTVYSASTTDLDQVVALWAGMALREDGSLWSWGRNDTGQLGIGHAEVIDVAMRTLKLSDPVAFAKGGVHNLALLEDGTVWAWGSQSLGQLGDGVIANAHRSVPLPVQDLSDVVEIAAGSNHSLALKGDGTVWGWGSSWNGQLGLGVRSYEGLPVQVSGPEGEGHLTGVVAIGAGGDRSFAVTDDGTLWAWGTEAVLTETGRLEPSHVPVEAGRVPDGIDLLADVVAFSHSDDIIDEFSLFLDQDGSVWAWGKNRFGQLGAGVTPPTSSFGAVRVRLSSEQALEDAVDIATGRMHGLAIREDGSLWSWGSNARGQLGSEAPVGTSTNPIPGRVVGLSDVQSVVAARDTSFALLDDGTVRAWGRNWPGGQIGDGTLDDRSVPTTVLARVPLRVSFEAGEVGAVGSTTAAMQPQPASLQRILAGRAAAEATPVAALQVSAAGASGAPLEVREGERDVEVLRARLRSPAASGGVTLRSITLEALVAGAGVEPADLVAGVHVFLVTGATSLAEFAEPLATTATFDRSGRIHVQLREGARLQAGEAAELVVTYDIVSRRSALPWAGVPLAALLLVGPTMLRARAGVTWSRSRTHLMGALIAAVLAGCAQTPNVSQPHVRQVQAVLTSVEVETRAGVHPTIVGLPLQGAVITVKP